MNEVFTNMVMGSVTQVVKNTKQPRGGYLPVKNFEVLQIYTEELKNEYENINPGLVGTAVDYLTRYILIKDKEAAFSISILGAKRIGKYRIAKKLLRSINLSLDDITIISATRLVTFDSVVRAGVKNVTIDKHYPNNPTIDHIRTMVNRTIKYLLDKNEKIDTNLTFPGGYTIFINSGDADYKTSITLIDLKTNKRKITSKDSLQLLIYYLLGLHSIYKEEYETLKYLEIFNARLGVVFKYNLSNLSQDIIDTINKNIIGYFDESADFNHAQDIERKKQIFRNYLKKQKRKRIIKNILNLLFFISIILISIYFLSFFKQISLHNDLFDNLININNQR